MPRFSSGGYPACKISCFYIRPQQVDFQQSILKQFANHRGPHSPGIQPIHYGFHLGFFNIVQEAGLLLTRLTAKFG